MCYYEQSPRSGRRGLKDAVIIRVEMIFIDRVFYF